MKTLEIAKAPESLVEFVQNLNDKPLALMHGSRPIAVLLPIQHSDLETIALNLNPKFHEVPMILRYDLKSGDSKMRVGATVMKTLRMMRRLRSALPA